MAWKVPHKGINILRSLITLVCLCAIVLRVHQRLESDVAGSNWLRAPSSPSDVIECPCGGFASRNASYLRSHKDCSAECRRDPACTAWNVFCNASLYQCPQSGLIFTYPLPTTSQLSDCYSMHYTGQATLRLNHPRVVSQHAFVQKYLSGTLQSLRIAEMGCAAGYLLHQFMRDNNTLECFELSPSHHAIFVETMQTYARAVLHKSLFDKSQLPKDSIDLFLSSHVVEHIPDPCSLLKDIFYVLKSGGYMFHEIPQQNRHQILRRQGGTFHTTFWTPESVRSIFSDAGFEHVAIETFSDHETVDPTGRGRWIRTIWRKPIAQHTSESNIQSDVIGIGL